MARALAALLCMAGTLAACATTTPSEGRDAGVPPDEGATPIEPTSPAPPRAVDLRCPEGWVGAGDGVCRPPSVSTEPCTSATRRVGDACVPIGPPCPVDRFPSGLTGDVLYVDAAADRALADGTRDRPFADVASASARARPGTTIMLAAGTYAGQVVLEDGVTLRGACSAAVLIGGADGMRGVVEAQGTSVVIRDLAIRSDVQRGVQALFANDVTLESVVIERANDVALNFGRGATLRASDIVVRSVLGVARAVNVQEGALAEIEGLETVESTLFVSGTDSRLRLRDTRVAGGRVLAREGGSLALDEVVVANALGFGVRVEGGATLESAGLTIVDPVPASRVARVLLVTGGARARVSRLHARGGSPVPIQVNGAGSMLAIDGAAIEGGRSEPDIQSGAIQIDEEATASLTRVLVSDVEGTGVIVHGRLDAMDLWIREVRVPRSPSPPVGIRLFGAAGIERMRIEDQAGWAIVASGEAARGEIDDLEVRRLSGHFVDERVAVGSALLLDDRASLTLRRALVEDTRYVALDVSGGAALRAEDLVVRDARASDGSPVHASALQVVAASASLSRARIERTLGWGIDLWAASTLQAQDLVIEGVVPLEEPWSLGWGIALQAIEASQIEIARARISGAVGVGLWLDGEGTRAVLDGFDVRDTTARTCAATMCTDAPAGMGIGVYGGATLAMRRFEIARSSLCGIHLGPSASADLASGAVRMNDIGVCVHEPGYDLTRLTTEVAFEANGVPIDAASFAVPTPPRPPEL